MKRIRDLLQTIEVLEKRPGRESETRISGLAYHSAEIQPGNIFVCIRGYKTDGHLYLKAAEKNGAAAAIVESFQDDVNISQYRVADSRKALAALAAAFYNHPSLALTLTGITATNGKTTTAYMLENILQEHGFKTGLIGTVIIKTGKGIRPAGLTTPESLDLQGIFAEMSAEGLTHAVMEVSSSGLDLKRVACVDFDLVVLNNISREHIDLHGSFEAYREAKSSLVRQAKPGSKAVLNIDCPNCASLVGQTAAEVFTYGLKAEKADYLVRNLDLSSGRARFIVKPGQVKEDALRDKLPGPFPVELGVLGLHSVYNAMAAITSALLLGVPVTAIQEALRKFKGVERRFELIFEDNFSVIDDHFANSGNIDVTLETLQMMDYRNLHLVYAIRGGRGVTVNRENATALARWAPCINLKKVIATTSSGHTPEKDRVTPEELEIFKAVMDKAGLKTEIYGQLSEAVKRGVAETGSGDVLLLAGCQGMDHGARICLEEISRIRPDLAREDVLAALKNRVAGV